MNVVSTEYGAIKKRMGSTQLVKAGQFPAGVEFRTIGAVTVSGTPYLIVAGSTKLYSINAAGEVSEIGHGFTEAAAGEWCIIQAPVSTAVASQGPIYLSNGTDPVQYWTGAAKNTEVKEWTGLASSVKPTDLETIAGTQIIKSAKEGKFDQTDIGLLIKFTVPQEVITNEKGAEAFKVTYVEILEVKSEKEIVVVLEEDAHWVNTKAAIEGEIIRETYEDSISGKHVPNGKYMIFAGNHIWVAGISDDTSAIRFSGTAPVAGGGEQSDPSYWPKENMVRFDSSDGNPITGIGTVGPYVVVFKKNKTWVIHNLDTGENRKLADTIGCVSHRSIVETVLGTFFLTADQGIYLTEGSKLRELSYNVRPTILAINPNKLAQAAGAYFNNHYYLSFAYESSTPNNRTLDYDVMLKSWWLHDLSPTQWTVWEYQTGQTFLWGITPGKEKGVSKCFVASLFTDLGANYTGNGILGAWWISPWEPFAYYVFRHRIKAPFLKKRLRAVFFDGSGEIIPLVYRNFATSGTQSPGVVDNALQSSPTFPVNFSGGEPIWANPNEAQKWAGEEFEGFQLIWGGAAETRSARVYSPGIGRVWSVGFGNNTNMPFEVDSFAYFVQFRKS